MKSLSALVTGASGEIGSRIATELARSGYGVIVAYCSNHAGAKEVAQAVADLGQPSRTISFDVSIRQEVLTAREELLSEGWKISGLVNNAGVADFVPFADITDTRWHRMMDTNLYGPFVTTQIFLPDILESRVGRIVNIGSIGGQLGGVNQVHYAVAKAGLIGLTKSISRLHSSSTFTVNCVAPGPIVSQMIAAQHAYNSAKEEDKVRRDAKLGLPEEVASLVSYLMSPSASHVSGQVIGVNGGAVAV